MKGIAPILVLALWLAHPTITSAERIKPEDWGVATNGAQIYLGLATGGNQIELGDPLVLLIRLRNVSTNKTFKLAINGMVEMAGPYTLAIVSPSGKNIPLEPFPIPQSGLIPCILGPNQTTDVEYHLRQRSKYAMKMFKMETFEFDELGTYRITAQAVGVTSKPLCLSVVPKGTNASTRFAAYETPPWTRFRMVADPNELPQPIAFGATPAAKKDDHFELVTDSVSGSHAIITPDGVVTLKDKEEKLIWSRDITKTIGHCTVTSAYLDRETIGINCFGGRTGSILMLCKDGAIVSDPYY